MKDTLSNPTKLLPMIITDELAATRAFYVDTLGWKTTHDLDGYVQVRSGDPDGPELGFMSPGEAPMLRQAFRGKGLLVSVPVADADAHHEALKTRGAAPLTEPSLKPWGWRGFFIADPNGLLLDFFHVAEAPAIAPAV